MTLSERSTDSQQCYVSAAAVVVILIIQYMYILLSDGRESLTSLLEQYGKIKEKKRLEAL